jgi:rubrerythrin
MLEFIAGYSAGTKGQARAASLARSMEASQSGRHTDRLEHLNGKVENLGVIVRAMWSLLQEQGMTSEQLMDRIEEIHAEMERERNDGIPEAVRCTNCDSMVARGLSNCQICGEQVRDNQPDPLAI